MEIWTQVSMSCVSVLCYDLDYLYSSPSIFSVIIMMFISQINLSFLPNIDQKLNSQLKIIDGFISFEESQRLKYP